MTIVIDFYGAVHPTTDGYDIDIDGDVLTVPITCRMNEDLLSFRIYTYRTRFGSLQTGMLRENTLRTILNE